MSVTQLGPSRGVRDRRRSPRTVSTRSRSPREAERSAHRPDLWARKSRRGDRSRDGARRGSDIGDRIGGGPIPIDEALPIAKQIAEALEGAHEQGIIHHELKPGNIKIRADGTVKVLDFGLAKAMEVGGAGQAGVAGREHLSLSPTMTSPGMTHAGIILGTAAYMSPEQAAGKP